MFWGTRVMRLVWVCLAVACVVLVAGLVVGVPRGEARAMTQSQSTWLANGASSDTIELRMDDGRVLRVPRAAMEDMGKSTNGRENVIIVPSGDPMLDSMIPQNRGMGIQFPSGMQSPLRTPSPLSMPGPLSMPSPQNMPMSMPSPSRSHSTSSSSSVSSTVSIGSFWSSPVLVLLVLLAVVLVIVKTHRSGGTSHAPTEVHEDAERNGSYTTGVGAVPVSVTTESKLRELDRLRGEGLLTPEEYQIHRQRILNSF